ncbi:MAG: phosphohistidine phosphatase [Deltaproteobacteria bacterium]|nr:MAG: phosphohistidine phosphatase [Deltaproteobacteria bacterium]PIE74959.1 MAG: phosphohistidine phosphatase [Deltaproteobacteria bacterium]
MKNSFEKIIVFIATGAYSGKISFAPGTFGTLAGIPLVLLVSLMPESFMVVFTAFFIIFSVYFADKASVILDDKDPKEVVIDEIAGYFITVSGIVLSFGSVVTGFLLFRFFDILKPGLVRKAERYFKGGSGIVFDDIIAGIFANLILRIIF